MRKLMKPLLLSVGLFVCPAIAICQQPVSATLSLSDAIALAREHNPAYRQTIHDRSPAAWGVRNAWSSLWLPSVTASGGVGYAGPGEQNFLTSSFSQSVSTWSSSYSFLLDWTLNGQTISQPGLKKAQLNAAEADVVGAGGPRNGTAHRHVHRPDPDLAAQRPARHGRAAEPLAQGAARARARRRVGREGGLIELGSIGGAVGRLVRLHAEAVRHQSDDRGDPAERANGLLGVRVRERRVAEHGTDPAQLRPAGLHRPPGAGAPGPEQPLSVPLHAAAVPGAAHRLDPVVE